MEFHIWYRKENGWLQRTQTGGYATSAAGVDVAEKDEITLSEDHLLPESDNYADKLSKTVKMTKLILHVLDRASAGMTTKEIFYDSTRKHYHSYRQNRAES